METSVTYWYFRCARVVLVGELLVLLREGGVRPRFFRLAFVPEVTAREWLPIIWFMTVA